MSDALDAVVIGASAAGLVAATYLARAGAKVAVFEAGGSPGGSELIAVGNRLVPAAPPTIYALDPRVIRDLKLANLTFAARDLRLVGLRSEGKPLALGRDRYEAARSVGAGAEQFISVRRNYFAFARAMRAAWWENGTVDDHAVTAELHRYAVTSASGFLEAAFESEALKAAFAFDVLEGGLSPWAAGTALVLAWRAAQEMCGLQGAVAIPRGGRPALLDILEGTAQAAGVEIHAGAPVAQLLLKDDRAAGVVLQSGDVVPSRNVLSALSRRRTLLELLPTGSIGFEASLRLGASREVGEALLLFTLEAVPGFAVAQPAARFVMADRLEASSAAYAVARAGGIPVDLALEAVVPTEVDPDLAPNATLLAVTARPLPVAPPQGWPALLPALVGRVTGLIERRAPGLRATITGLNVVPPKSGRDPLDVTRITAGWGARITTPVEGLFLCGDAAEPVPSLSCRAARHAAGLVLVQLKERAA